MCNIYRPAKAFVIDVCYTQYGPRIVELGCINCAGFYHSDMQKLIMALEENSDYLIESESELAMPYEI